MGQYVRMGIEERGKELRGCAVSQRVGMGWVLIGVSAIHSVDTITTDF